MITILLTLILGAICYYFNYYQYLFILFFIICVYCLFLSINFFDNKIISDWLKEFEITNVENIQNKDPIEYDYAILCNNLVLIPLGLILVLAVHTYTTRTRLCSN